MRCGRRRDSRAKEEWAQGELTKEGVSGGVAEGSREVWPKDQARRSGRCDRREEMWMNSPMRCTEMEWAPPDACSEVHCYAG